MNAATQPGNFNELNFIGKSYLVKDLNGLKYCVEGSRSFIQLLWKTFNSVAYSIQIRVILLI